MNCDQHRKRELGQIDAEQFALHAANCPTCQTQLRQDEELLELARDLRQPVFAPQLWDRIEEELQTQMRRDQNKWRRVFQRRSSAVYKVAAILALSIGLGTYLSAPGAPDQPRLFSKSALEQVEETERQYIDAIAALEQEASNHMARMDPSLMLLYRDKLETIETQIAYCKEALIDNPANAHIRRYLLIALQDKKKALQEIISNPINASFTDT